MITDTKQIAVNTERLNKVEQHIETTNHEMGEMRDTMVEIKTDMKWFKKMIWWVIGVMVAGFSGLASLIIYHLSATK